MSGPSLRPEELIFARYRLRKILGRGGMGVVWLAHDERLERDVALKFLPEVLHSDPGARDDLKRETRKSLELTHPNIVRIHDFVEDEERAAISMEYVDGQTLSHLRVSRANKVLEPMDIKPWIAGLCSALDYAHQVARLIHRDLKPSNLMINSRGTLKVADFGIACSLMNTAGRVSMQTSSGGTMAYMSPQQLLGEQASPLDDIYALGATLYELLTSKPPFYTGNISMQAREATVEPMNDRRRQLGIPGEIIPPAWERAIASCLAKDPQARPQTASALVAMLDLYGDDFDGDAEVTLRSLPPEIAAPVATLTDRWRPVVAWVRNHHAIGWGVALLLASTLIVGRYVTHANKPPVASVPVLAGRGGLMVKSDPSGAMVTLGGEAVETTPASFSAIPAGSYPLKIMLEDYDPVELTAEIKGNQFADLGVVPLRRSTGTLQIISIPGGSSYELQSTSTKRVQRTGITPETVADLPTGRYFLVMRRDGWPERAQQVDVEAGKTLPISWEFGRGRLQVTSEPAGAMVLEGDRQLGQTPLDVQIPAGPHNLRLELRGHAPADFTAQILPDATAALPVFTLRQSVGSVTLQTTPKSLEYELRYATEPGQPAGDPISTGRTPADLGSLASAKYQITFRHPGSPDSVQEIDVVHGESIPISAAFEEGTVRFTSDPSGAEILLGDQALGITPFSIGLGPGPQKVVARLKGYTDRSRSVTVTAGAEVKSAISFRSSGSSSSRRKAPPKKEESVMSKMGDSLKSIFQHKPRK